MQSGRDPEQLRGVFIFGEVLRRCWGEGLEGRQIGIGSVHVHGHAAYRLQVAELLGQAGRAGFVVDVVEGKMLGSRVRVRPRHGRWGELRGERAVGGVVLHLGAEGGFWGRRREVVVRLEAVAVRVADEAQGSGVALHGVVVVVAIHVANGFGDVVVVIADGDLGRMAPTLLVDSLQLAGSFRRL